MSNLVEDKALIFPHGVHGVPIGGLGFGPPLCILWKSKQVNLHIYTNLFICQELT